MLWEAIVLESSDQLCYRSLGRVTLATERAEAFMISGWPLLHELIQHEMRARLNNRASPGSLNKMERA